MTVLFLIFALFSNAVVGVSAEDEPYKCDDNQTECGPRWLLTDMIPKIPLWTTFKDTAAKDIGEYTYVTEPDSWGSAMARLELYQFGYDYCREILTYPYWEGALYTGPFGRGDIIDFFKNRMDNDEDCLGYTGSLKKCILSENFYFGAVQFQRLGLQLNFGGFMIGPSVELRRQMTVGMKIGVDATVKPKKILCGLDFNSVFAKGLGLKVGKGSAATFGTEKGRGIKFGTQFNTLYNSASFDGRYTLTLTQFEAAAVAKLSASGKLSAGVGGTQLEIQTNAYAMTLYHGKPPIRGKLSYFEQVQAGLTCMLPERSANQQLWIKYLCDRGPADGDGGGVEGQVNVAATEVYAAKKPNPWKIPSLDFSIRISVSKAKGKGVTFGFYADENNQLQQSVGARNYAMDIAWPGGASPLMRDVNQDTWCQNPTASQNGITGYYYFTHYRYYEFLNTPMGFHHYLCNLGTHCPHGSVRSRADGIFETKEVGEGGVNRTYKCTKYNLDECCEKSALGKYAQLPRRGFVDFELAGNKNLNTGHHYLSYTDATECKDCNPGRYNDDRGNYRCKPCALGTYSLEVGRTYSCERCPEGWFQNEIGKTYCKICVQRWQDEWGMSGCKMCPPGQFYSGSRGVIHTRKKCSVCPSGWAGYKNKVKGTDPNGITFPSMVSDSSEGSFEGPHDQQTSKYCSRCEKYQDINHKQITRKCVLDNNRTDLQSYRKCINYWKYEEPDVELNRYGFGQISKPMYRICSTMAVDWLDEFKPFGPDFYQCVRKDNSGFSGTWSGGKPSLADFEGDTFLTNQRMSNWDDVGSDVLDTWWDGRLSDDNSNYVIEQTLPRAPHCESDKKYLVPYTPTSGRCMYLDINLNLTKWQCGTIKWVDKTYPERCSDRLVQLQDCEIQPGLEELYYKKTGLHARYILPEKKLTGCHWGVDFKRENRPVYTEVYWNPYLEHWPNDHRENTQIDNVTNAVECNKIHWDESYEPKENYQFLQDTSSSDFDDVWPLKHKMPNTRYTRLVEKTPEEMRDYYGSNPNLSLFKHYQPDSGQPECRSCPLGKQVKDGGFSCKTKEIPAGMQEQPDMYYASICPHNMRPSSDKKNCVNCPTGFSSRGLSNYNKISTLDDKTIIQPTCTCQACVGDDVFSFGSLEYGGCKENSFDEDAEKAEISITHMDVSPRSFLEYPSSALFNTITRYKEVDMQDYDSMSDKMSEKFTPDIKIKCYSDNKGYAAPLIHCLDTNCDDYDIMIGTINDIATFKHTDDKWRRLANKKHWEKMLRRGQQTLEWRLDARYYYTEKDPITAELEVKSETKFKLEKTLNVTNGIISDWSYTPKQYHWQHKFFNEYLNYMSADTREKGDWHDEVLAAVKAYCKYDTPHKSNMTALFLHYEEGIYTRVADLNVATYVRPTTVPGETFYLINTPLGIQEHPFYDDSKKGFLPYGNKWFRRPTSFNWLPTEFRGVTNMQDCSPSLVDANADGKIDLFVACNKKIYQFLDIKGAEYDNSLYRKATRYTLGKTDKQWDETLRTIDEKYLIIDIGAKECWQKTNCANDDCDCTSPGDCTVTPTVQFETNIYDPENECKRKGVCAYVNNGEERAKTLISQASEYAEEYYTTENDCFDQGYIWESSGYIWKEYSPGHNPRCEDKDGNPVLIDDDTLSSSSIREQQCWGAGFCYADPNPYNPASYETEKECRFAGPYDLNLNHANRIFEWKYNELLVNRNADKETGNMALSFYDIDDDGDKDMFIGTKTGNLLYVENLGNQSKPTKEYCKWIPGTCEYNTDSITGVKSYNCVSCALTQEKCTLEKLLWNDEVKSTCRGRRDDCYALGGPGWDKKFGYCSTKRAGTGDSSKSIPDMWTDELPNSKGWQLGPYGCQKNNDAYWVPFKYDWVSGEKMNETNPKFTPPSCFCGGKERKGIRNSATCIRTPVGESFIQIWDKDLRKKPKFNGLDVKILSNNEWTLLHEANFGEYVVPTFDTEGGLYIGDKTGKVKYFLLQVRKDTSGVARKQWQEWRRGDGEVNLFETKRYLSNTCYNRDFDKKQFCNGTPYRSATANIDCCPQDQYVYYPPQENYATCCLKKNDATESGDDTHCCPEVGQIFNPDTGECDCVESLGYSERAGLGCCKIKTTATQTGDEYCCSTYGEMYNVDDKTCDCPNGDGFFSHGSKCCQSKSHPSEPSDTRFCCPQLGKVWDNTEGCKATPLQHHIYTLYDDGKYQTPIQVAQLTRFFPNKPDLSHDSRKTVCENHNLMWKKCSEIYPDRSRWDIAKCTGLDMRYHTYSKERTLEFVYNAWDQRVSNLNQFKCLNNKYCEYHPSANKKLCDQLYLPGKEFDGFVYYDGFNEHWITPTWRLLTETELEDKYGSEMCPLPDSYGCVLKPDKSYYLARTMDQSLCEEELHTWEGGDHCKCGSGWRQHGRKCKLINDGIHNWMQSLVDNVFDGKYFTLDNGYRVNKADVECNDFGQYSYSAEGRHARCACDTPFYLTQKRSIDCCEIKTISERAGDDYCCPKEGEYNLGQADQCGCDGHAGFISITGNTCWKCPANTVAFKSAGEILLEEKYCYDSSGVRMNKTDDCGEKQCASIFSGEEYRVAVQNKTETECLAMSFTTWDYIIPPKLESTVKNTFVQTDVTCRYMPATGLLANISAVEAPVVCPDHHFLSKYKIKQHGDLYYKYGGTCEPCPDGQENVRDISHWIAGVSQWTHTENQTYDTVCQSCAKDKYTQNQGQQCVRCPAGTGRSFTGPTRLEVGNRCETCPKGKFQDGQDGQSMTVTTFTRSGDSTLSKYFPYWDDWYKSPSKRQFTGWDDAPTSFDDTPKCMWCPPGKTSTVDKTTCISCNSNEYSSFKTNGECRTCEDEGGVNFEIVYELLAGLDRRQDIYTEESYVPKCHTVVHGCPPSMSCQEELALCNEITAPLVTDWTLPVFNYDEHLQQIESYTFLVNERCRKCPRGTYNNRYGDDKINDCKVCSTGKIAIADSGCQDCPLFTPITSNLTSNLVINRDIDQFSNAPGKRIPQARPQLAAMDLDGDGYMDIIVGTSDGLVRHFKQNPTTLKFYHVAQRPVTSNSINETKIGDTPRGWILDEEITLQKRLPQGFAPVTLHENVSIILPGGSIPYATAKVDDRVYFDIGDNASPAFFVEKEGDVEYIFLIIGTSNGIYYSAFEREYTQRFRDLEEIRIKDGNNETMSFTNPMPSFADVNNDGMMDFIVAESTGKIYVIHESQAGTFEDADQWTWFDIFQAKFSATPVILNLYDLYDEIFVPTEITGFDVKKIFGISTMVVGLGNTVRVFEIDENRENSWVEMNHYALVLPRSSLTTFRSELTWPSIDCASISTKRDCESVKNTFGFCLWYTGGGEARCIQKSRIRNNEHLMNQLGLSTDIYRCKDLSTECDALTADMKARCDAYNRHGGWKMCTNDQDCRERNSGYTQRDNFENGLLNFQQKCPLSCNADSGNNLFDTCPDTNRFPYLPGTWLSESLHSVAPVIADFDKDGFVDVLIGFNRPYVTSAAEHLNGIEYMKDSLNWEKWISDGNFKFFKSDTSSHLVEQVPAENPMDGIDLATYSLEYSSWRTCMACPSGKFANESGLTSADACHSCSLGTQQQALFTSVNGIEEIIGYNCVPCDFEIQYSEFDGNEPKCYDIECDTYEVLVDDKNCYDSSSTRIVGQTEKACLLPGTCSENNFPNQTICEFNNHTWTSTNTWDWTWYKETNQTKKNIKRCEGCSVGKFGEQQTCKQCPSGYYSESTDVQSDPVLFSWSISEYPSLYGLSGQSGLTVTYEDIQNKISEWNDTGAVRVYMANVDFRIGPKRNQTIEFAIDNLESTGQWVDYEEEICVDEIGIEIPGQRSNSYYKEAVGFTKAECTTGGSCIIVSKSLETRSHSTVWGCIDPNYTDKTECESNGRCSTTYGYTTKVLCETNDDAIFEEVYFDQQVNSFLGYCRDTSVTGATECESKYDGGGWIQNVWKKGISAVVHTNNYKLDCETTTGFTWVDNTYYTGVCIDKSKTNQTACEYCPECYNQFSNHVHDRKWIPNTLKIFKTLTQALTIEKPGQIVQQGPSECKLCPATTPVSTNGIECVACPDGLGYINGECSKCPNGQVPLSSQCSVCRAGTYHAKTMLEHNWESTCAGWSYEFNNKCNFNPKTTIVGRNDTNSSTYYLVTEGTCESAGYEMVHYTECQTAAAELNIGTSDESWQTAELAIPTGCVHNTLKTYKPLLGARYNPPPLLARLITNCSETWRCVCKRNHWKEEEVQDGFNCPSWDDCTEYCTGETSEMYQYLNNACNGKTPWDASPPEVCRTCPTGFYQQEEGQIECKKCPNSGNYTGDWPRKCNACAAGRFLGPDFSSNPGSYACNECSYGRYQDDHASTSCKQCPAGWQVTHRNKNITVTTGILITETTHGGPIDSFNKGDTYGDTGYIITNVAWDSINSSKRIGVMAEKTRNATFDVFNETHVGAIRGSQSCERCPAAKYKSEDMHICRSCYDESVPTEDQTDCYCGEASGDERKWMFYDTNPKTCKRCQVGSESGYCRVGKAYCGALYDHNGHCHECQDGPVCIDNYAYCNKTNYDCIKAREPWQHPWGCVNDCKFLPKFDCAIYNTSACLNCTINATWFKPPCFGLQQLPGWIEFGMTEAEIESASYLELGKMTCLKNCGAITYTCPAHDCTYEYGSRSNCCHSCKSDSWTTSSAKYIEFMQSGCDPQDAPWLRNCSDYQTETDCDAQDDICEWKEPDSTPWADSCASTCVRYRNKQFSAPYIDMEDSVCSCPYKMDECYHYCGAEWKTFIRNECDPDYAPDELKDLLNDACDNSVAVGQKWKPSWDGKDASDYCVGDCDAADAQPTCYKWEFHIPAQPAVVGWYGSKCDNAGAVTKTVNGMTIGGLGECSSEATDLENGLIANPSGTWPPGDESVCTEVKSACEDASDCNWGNYNCYAQYIQTATPAYTPTNMTATETFTEYCSRQNGTLILRGVDGRNGAEDVDQCWIPITLAEGQTCAGQNGKDLTNVINPANCVNIGDSCYNDCQGKWELWIETLDTYEFGHYSSGPTINGVQLSRYYQTRCKGNPKQGGWPPKDWHGAHEYGCPDHEKLKAENGVCPNKWEKPESWPGDRDDYCFANCPKCGSCGSCVPENHRCFMEQFDDKYPCTPAWQTWANNGCEGDPPWDETTNENTKYGCPRIEVSGSELAHPADKGRCEKPVPWAGSCASSCKFYKMGCPVTDTNWAGSNACWITACDANVAADKEYIDYINGNCAGTPPWDGIVVAKVAFWPEPIEEEFIAGPVTEKTCVKKKLIYEVGKLDIYKRYLTTQVNVEEFIPFYDVPLQMREWIDYERGVTTTLPECSQQYFLNQTTERWQQGDCEWLNSTHVCAKKGDAPSECFSGTNCNDVYYYETRGLTKIYDKSTTGQCWPNGQYCIFMAEDINFYDRYDPKYEQECVSMDCALAESVYNTQCMENNTAVICQDASAYFHQNCITC